MELIIASSLALLLLSILYQFSRSAYRVAHEEFERNSAEATIMLLSNQCLRDLASTTSAGLSIDASGQSLAIHPVSLTDTGFLTYENRFIAWQHDSQQEVVRRFEARTVSGVTLNGEAVRLNPTQLASLGSSPDFEENKRYSKIMDFRLENPSGVVAPHIGSPLTLKISVMLQLAHSRKQIDFERVIQLRTPAL